MQGGISSEKESRKNHQTTQEKNYRENRSQLVSDTSWSRPEYAQHRVRSFRARPGRPGQGQTLPFFHKSIKKGTRLWERTRENEVEQGLEGKALPLNNRTVVLATTGAPTLPQGTAVPVMLVAQSNDIDMVRVTKAVYASTHLNFSSPNVAQRLPLELKRTDDELKSRASQQRGSILRRIDPSAEIRRIR